MAKPPTKTTNTKPPMTGPRDGTLSRRALLQSVIAASAATTAAAAAAFPTTAAARLVPGTTATAGDAVTGLTQTETRLLTRVLNRLVPADGAMPGAGDIEVAQFIDDLLIEAPHLRRPILDVLTAVHTAGPATQASDAALDAQLTRIEQAHPAAFGVLVHATYTAYYSHPQVLDAIGWVPPDAEVAPPEPFDTTVLDAVRRRGPIYKDV